MLVLLARLAPTWHKATLLVQPETILRWHRHGFRLFWRRTSKHTGAPPRIAAEPSARIEQMATNNRLWGAERIRGELLTLHIRVAKRTIQRYLRQVRQPRPPGQRWATFLRNHADETWACDLLQTYDLLFRPIFAFFLLERGSRRVAHVGVTRSPSSAWATQQLREATPWGIGPRFLIRDNDDKSGVRFDEVAAGTGSESLRTPIRAPNANAFCERFLRSVRTECLDRVLILDEDHLASLLRRYCAYFNDARPHQGIAQKIPTGPPEPPAVGGKRIEETPILGGLHHDYRLAA
jgi:transposase InsO family protein